MKKKYIVLQEEKSDCGVCSLLSVIKYYGGSVPLEQLRISSMTTSSGVTAYNLIECAKKYGLEAKGIKTNNIEEIPKPFIAHLIINESLAHFSVVYQIKANYVYIMDPASGYKRINKDEFFKIFTNVVITLFPTNKIPFIKEEKTIPLILKDILKKHIKIICVITTLNILFFITSIVGSLYISFIKDNLFLILSIFISINVISYIIEYKMKEKINSLHLDISNNIMDKFYYFILSLPSKYIQLKGSGEILKRIDDLGIIIKISIITKLKIILNTLIIIPLFIIICSIIREIAFILIFIMIINIMITIKYNKKIINKIDENINFVTNYNSYIVNYITGITSIHHTNNKTYFLRNLKEQNNLKNKSDYLLQKTIDKYNLKINISVVIIEITTNILLFNYVDNNLINIKEMFILNILINLLITILLDSLKLLPNLYYKNRISKKIDEMLNIKYKKGKTLNTTFNNIVFYNVSYQYSMFAPTLKNISFKIEKGEKILIKGKNGCGKSTLFKILTKEYLNYKGSIKIGGIELKNINSELLEENISYLSQDESLFIGTIRENILLGEEKDLTEVIKICRLDRIIDKKTHGLDTFLYGGGEELSGGEKQLIILARHLIRYKEILIIDEGTSEINNKLENEIIKDIIRNYPEKILIFVSHKYKDYLFKKIIKLY